MKKIILIPDSFKGTMTAAEVCTVLAASVEKHFPQAEVVSVPAADGGEGTVDSFLTALGGAKITMPSQGPFGEVMDGFYGLLSDGTAIIEMAACAGLCLAAGRKNPFTASTYGVGLLIADALRRGAGKIVLGLGGSASNDGGCGAACALGVKFFDKDGNSFIPTGGTLKNIAKIDLSKRNEKLDKVRIVAMCDVDNPMYGREGAAYVFAPQKGASAKDIPILDDGLRHLCKQIFSDLQLDLSQTAGAGAAGAFGAGVIAFLGGNLQKGIDTVLQTVQFEELLMDTDLVITGEGKIDEQTLRGKVVAGVAKCAKKAGVPVVALVGDVGSGAEKTYAEGVTAIFSINTIAADFSKIRMRAKKDLEFTIDNLMRFCVALNLGKNR